MLPYTRATLSILPFRVGYCWSLCEHMTSSTKPEAHNVSQRRYKRPELQPQAACRRTDEAWKCDTRDVRTDRHTGRQTRLSRYSASDRKIMNCPYTGYCGTGRKCSGGLCTEVCRVQQLLIQHFYSGGSQDSWTPSW